MHGFYEGHSIPVNEKLSELFLQLHISEKTGRGVPTIVSKYSKKSISINDNFIIEKTPFNKINDVGDKVGDKAGGKVGDKILTKSQIKVLAEIRNNNNVTKLQLVILCSLEKTSIDNAIPQLKNRNIERMGSNKNGYWKGGCGQKTGLFFNMISRAPFSYQPCL